MVCRNGSISLSFIDLALQQDPLHFILCMNSFFKKYLSVAFITVPCFLGAQTPSEMMALKNEYQEQDAVYLHWREKLNIGWNAGEIDITRHHDSRMLFLGSASSALAERAISYTSFSKIENIRAETQVPVKDRYRAVEVADIKDINSVSGGVFYDDRREKSFVFPAIQQGAMADLKYEEKILEPRFLSAFFFRSYLPIVEADYTVTIDTGIGLRYILLGGDSSSIHFELSEENGRSIYHWKATKQPAMEYEPNAPSLLVDVPHVIVYLDRIGGEPMLSGASGLYSWYRSLTDSLNLNANPELIRLADEISADAQSDREIAERVFGWVQDNIRYVAFEDGLGGFVPREAGLVNQRKYGDCKDMANLLTALLQAKGLPARLTWIGTRDIPYRYDQVPTPLADNHMIASLVLDGEVLFLDATDDRLAFGYPSSFIQGKQAMIGMGDEFELVTVPEMPSKVNLVQEVSQIVIDGLEVRGTATTIWNGYPAFEIRSKLANVREDGIGRFLSGILELGNNKFSVSNQVISGQYDRNAPMSIQFEFSIPSYVRRVGDQIYLNMQLDRRLQQAQVDVSKRKRDREFEYRSEHVHKVSVDIPAGYQVANLPESISVEENEFGFSIEYRVENQKIIMERDIRIDLLLLPKESFAKWNTMINELAKAYQEVVVLEPIP
jgi:hypothetical protein